MSAFINPTFITSVSSPKQAPQDNLPGVLVVGRSNVGKSTLINKILGTKIAFASKKAGKTKSLNYFKVDDKFYLIDSPGFGSTGFATMSTVQFSTLMEECMADRRVNGVALLFDSRRNPNDEDFKFAKYILSGNKKTALILTKCDKCNQSELHKAKENASKMGFQYIFYSDDKSSSLDKIREAIRGLSK